MNVRNEIEIRELNGKEIPWSEHIPKMILESYQSAREWVTLLIDGKSATVNGYDLINATKNAMNR